MERKNKSNPFKVGGGGGGGGGDHQENMMSRFARQDLLRRRDLNSVMALHPRIMNNPTPYARPLAGGMYRFERGFSDQ